MTLATAAEGPTAILVGPIRIRVSAHPRLAAALDAVLAGFAAGPASEPVRCTIQLMLALGDLTSDEPKIARFARAGALPNAVVGRCEAWHARLEASDDTVIAHFGIRDTAALSPHLDDAWNHTVAYAAVASALRVALAYAAPLADGLLLHAAALVSPVDQRAWVFAGRSDEGKTTMTRRLAHWSALADDAVLVFRSHSEDAWFVAGTPLQGSERLPRSGAAFPLAGLMFLKKASTLELKRLDDASAFADLLMRMLWFFEPDARIASLAHDLVAGVPCGRLRSALEHDVGALLSPTTPTSAS